MATITSEKQPLAVSDGSVLTPGQGRRIARERETWGGGAGQVWSGLEEMFKDLCHLGASAQDAIHAVKGELAYRLLWMYKARRTPERGAIVISEEDVDELVADM